MVEEWCVAVLVPAEVRTLAFVPIQGSPPFEQTWGNQAWLWNPLRTDDDDVHWKEFVSADDTDDVQWS